MINATLTITTQRQVQTRKVGIHPNHNENDLYGETIGRKADSAKQYPIQEEKATYFAIFTTHPPNFILGS